MAELIAMPKLGFDMQEGTLVTWLKKEGDTVVKGEIIAEIETDKATIEVEAFVEGTLLKLLVAENTLVPVGASIAVLGEPGETFDLAALGVGEAATEGQPGTSPDGAPGAAPPPDTRVVSPGADGGLPEGVRASPLARRMARERGINLAQVQGSGPHGRIVKADLETFLAGAPVQPTAPTAVPVGPDSEEVPTPRMRKLIGQRMVASKTSAPHFYVTTEIDMQAALDLRKQINARLSDERKVSVNDMAVKAAALALREFPNVNSSFNGETIVRHNRVNVGIAVALENGLINVVSKDADVTPLTVMAPLHKEMIGRAREGKVRPSDVEAGTFTVSNLGAYEVDHFIAIVNPPEAAILAVGSARRVPVVDDNGQLAVGLRMKATLSADHRVTDGAEAARFMQVVKALLEDPLRLMT